MPKNITFREHLLGSVNDFSEACSMGQIVKPTILVELIVTLARYREEGVKLSPEVYLCNNINSILPLVPEHGILHIGNTKLSEDGIKEVLKKCAPLASGGWCIFIEGNGEYLNYGLFRGSVNPISVPIQETLFSGTSAEVKVVGIHQTAEDCVEIRSYNGISHNIFLSHKKEDSPEPGKYLNDLVHAVTNKIPDPEKESVNTFLARSIGDALYESHGSLIAVCRSNKIPTLLSDGIHLKDPIDFRNMIMETRRDKILSLALSSEVSILKGMLKCDGIVVFSRDAKLLAYNCFVSSQIDDAGPSIGGARRRAFNVLCNKKGKGIYAAFIQSQDGWSNFRRTK